MIDWQVELVGGELYKEDHWYFPDFRIQEYLLPILNVGFDFIDEYSDTTFDCEDCKRLMGNLKFLENILEPRAKSEIQFDSLADGLVSLNKEAIENCMEKLACAARRTIDSKGKMKFFGD